MGYYYYSYKSEGGGFANVLGVVSNNVFLFLWYCSAMDGETHTHTFRYTQLSA